MTKFIACNDGTYVNIAHILDIYVDENNDVCGTMTDGGQFFMLNTIYEKEKAQEWLNKFMDKYDLVIQPPTASRCY